MKAKIYDINGRKSKEITLPNCFSGKIREDILSKVLEAKKRQQPYSPSPVAGKQHSAKGKIVHRRHVWRSGYGRGASRVPRKIFLTRGSQFNWEAAEVPHAKGGMRAHPPKVASMINTKKINKKEMKIALISAISATAEKKRVVERYARLEEKDIVEVPLIVESNINGMKVKDFTNFLKKILGEKIYEIAIKKKSIRAGKGKMRGRKYKHNAGLLVVLGKNENLKTKIVEVVKTNELGVVDLARGGLGRLTLYTEEAINELNNKFKEKK